MPATNYLLRLAKIISVAGIGLLSLLIFTGNVTDYYSNYYFVEHVMKMDTTFPGSSIHYRSIDTPFLYHAGYIFIILLEGFIAFSCLLGTILLFKNRNESPETFHAVKNWAVAGIITGIVIWFIGFEVIGGEWFAMWQSSSWNGLASAERILNFFMFTLVLLHLKD
jgi:predicted small integral membrane protein